MKNELNNVLIAKQILGDIENIPRDIFSDNERMRFAEILTGSVLAKATKIVIGQDDGASGSPRDWSNANTFVSFDNRVSGDDNGLLDLIEAIESSRDYKMSWGDEFGNLEDPDSIYLLELIKQCSDIEWQFVYLYDHGDYALSTSRNSCRFDTSRIGFIFITHERACLEWGWKRLSPKRKKHVEEAQDSEIKTLHQYVSGLTSHLPDNWKELELVRE